MIPPVREFLLACDFLSRRFAWDLSPHDEDLIEALSDARFDAECLVLAGGDEPAALFFAFAARSAWLGEDYVGLVIAVTRNHASTLGRWPAGDPRVLTRRLVRHAHEIAAGLTSFETFRAWLAEELP
jgi:hypothetical protein